MKIILVCLFLVPCSGLAADPSTNEAQTQLQASEQAIERYLDRQIREANKTRETAWKRDLTSIAAYEKSIEPWCAKLWELLGGSNYQSAPLNPKLEPAGEFDTHKAYRVWLTAFEDVTVYGIL